MNESSNRIDIAGKKTNFDLYLEQQLKDPAFTERFEKASETWDIALQAASICKV
jgi:hypothetical protein